MAVRSARLAYREAGHALSRNISAAVTSASQSATVQHRWLVEVYSLSTGTTRACTGYQFIVANANTYSPIGHLGGAEKIQEESDVFPRAVRLWFSAVNTAQIQDVLTENMFNRPVRIYRTFLTNSYTNVATPEELFRGFINTCDLKLKDDERGDYFEIEVESRLQRSPRAQYFNRETLWTFYGQSGDTYFDYLSKIPLSQAFWGSLNPVDFNSPLPPRSPPRGPGRPPPGGKH
jgi:hypothetical protein